MTRIYCTRKFTNGAKPFRVWGASAYEFRLAHAQNPCVQTPVGRAQSAATAGGHEQP